MRKSNYRARETSQARAGTARRGRGLERAAAIAKLAVVLVAAFVAASALEARADDQPAKPQAPQAGSARAVVVTFFQSFSDGNARALRDAVLADSDDERKVADGMADVAAAVAAARKAIVSKFNVRDQDINVHIIPVEMFNSMTEKVEADTATVMQGQEVFMALKKVNGTWKIPLGELLKKGGKTTDQTMADLRGSIDRVGQVTKEIESGKFTNADEAAKAISEAVPTRG